MSFHNYMKTVISGIKEWVNSIVPHFPSASIGQTIVVKSVDDTGKPTEWEAVDMPDIPEPVQPDWNQNDETQPDYVKNRTHWVDGVTATTLYSGTFTPDESEDGIYSMYIFNPAPTWSFEDGETYTVIWDEVEYVCVAFSNEYGTYIGNGAIWGSTQGGDEPFLMGAWVNEELDISTTEAGNHTFSIIANKEDIVELPRKFIASHLEAVSALRMSGAVTLEELYKAQAAIEEEGRPVFWDGKRIKEFYLSDDEFLYCFPKEARYFIIVEDGNGMYSRTMIRSSKEYYVIQGEKASFNFNNAILSVSSRTGKETLDYYAEEVAFNIEPPLSTCYGFKVYWDGTIEGRQLILPSSTEGSSKRFKITIDDTGTLTVTELTETEEE